MIFEAGKNDEHLIQRSLWCLVLRCLFRFDFGETWGITKSQSVIAATSVLSCYQLLRKASPNDLNSSLHPFFEILKPESYQCFAKTSKVFILAEKMLVIGALKT